MNNANCDRILCAIHNIQIYQISNVGNLDKLIFSQLRRSVLKNLLHYRQMYTNMVRRGSERLYSTKFFVFIFRFFVLRITCRAAIGWLRPLFVRITKDGRSNNEA